MGAGTAAVTAVGVAEAAGEDRVAATAARAVARGVGCARGVGRCRAGRGVGVVQSARAGAAVGETGLAADWTAALTEAAAAGGRSDAAVVIESAAAPTTPRARTHLVMRPRHDGHGALPASHGLRQPSESGRPLPRGPWRHRW